MLQCVAVCCSVLQCVSVCLGVLQCVAMYCSGSFSFFVGDTWFFDGTHRSQRHGSFMGDVGLVCGTYGSFQGIHIPLAGNRALWRETGLFYG